MPTRAPSDVEDPPDLLEDLLGARPEADPLGVEQLRASVERALFGTVEVARLDRFELRAPIARGGMGMIHRARDPRLEREVALKVLHPRLHGEERAKERLIAEARVLARLSHPNVVPVFEVVEVEDQVVIVMELVEGATLFEWERAKPRSWREIVAVYAQAARGLAAAHEIGIVHRDFKPSNAIVGGDGRVRVLDFGLARAEPEATSAASAASASAALTMTGEVLGTIGYMAPEQLAGEPATAASDQFSFCVALHRALFGSPAFAGTNGAELHASIARGYVLPARATAVPAWLRAAVARGLAFSPADRFPSMDALLAELERDRGWRRGTVLASGAAVLAIAGVATFALARSGAPRALTCDDETTAIAETWGEGAARRVAEAFDRAATPYAAVAREQVTKMLDEYRDRWSVTHHAACVTQRAAPDDVRLAAEYLRTRTCLERRRQDLVNAVEVIAAVDASTLDKAVDVVAGLAPVETCADVEALPEEPDPPTSAAVAVRVAAMRAQLSRASSLERAGRSEEALALVDTVLVDARATAYPPALLEATLARGTLLLFRFDFAHAVPPLTLAEQMANEQRQYGLAVVASARRIYAEGVQGLALESLEGRAQALELFSRGLRADRFARPLLLNYLGVLHMTRGERDRARESFQAAQRARDEVRSTDRELADIDMNVAMLTADDSERERLAQAAWQRFVAQLGPTHPTTLYERCRHAIYSRDRAAALAIAREANDALRRYHPEKLTVRSECLTFEGMIALDLGERAPARERFDEVVALARTAPPSTSLLERDMAAGYASYLRQEYPAARASFGALVTEYGASPAWWDQWPTAEGLFGSALVEEALAARGPEHAARAKALYAKAIPLFEALAGHNYHLANATHLARARAAVARP